MTEQNSIIRQNTWKTPQKVCEVQEDLLLSIMEGSGGTGDSVIDFALIACGGVYDEDIITSQYRQLRNLPVRQAGKQILVVQTGDTVRSNNQIYILRNVYFAQLQSGLVEFDIQNQQISIPVEPHVTMYREVMRDIRFVYALGTHNTERLHVGFLNNQYCPQGHATTDRDGMVGTPRDSVCDIYIHPWSHEELFQKHGINDILLRSLVRESMRARSRSIVT